MGLEWIEARRQTAEMIRKKKKKKWGAETIRGNDVRDNARSTTPSVCCHLHIPRAQIAAVRVEK